MKTKIETIVIPPIQKPSSWCKIIPVIVIVIVPVIVSEPKNAFKKKNFSPRPGQK